MLKTIWKTFKHLMASKKAQMAFISAIVWGVGKLGFELDPDVLLPMVGPLWGYIFMKGASEIGEAAALAKAPTKVNDSVIPIKPEPEEE
jgi:hypothetical protein